MNRKQKRKRRKYYCPAGFYFFSILHLIKLFTYAWKLFAKVTNRDSLQNNNVLPEQLDNFSVEIGMCLTNGYNS